MYRCKDQIALPAAVTHHCSMRLSSALFVASVIALVFSAAPIIATTAASLIASAADCAIHEGGPQSCKIAGLDLGPWLYQMGVSFWLVILSWLYIPVAIVLLVVGVIARRADRNRAQDVRKVGMIFWLVFLAAIFAPFEFGFSAILLLIAAIFIARRHFVRVQARE